MKKTIELILFVSSFLLINQSAKAQIFSIGNDTTICPDEPLTFTSTVGGVPSGGIQLLNLGDDIFSGVIPIGFPFNFYGNIYSDVILSTNFYIQFDLAGAGAYSPWPISAAIPSPTNPMNSIMGPWEDIYPPAGGVIKYGICGVAPFRVFLFDMDNVPMFSCNPLLFTGQIQLYETTNVIEIHLTNKPLCPGWNSGRAIEGVHNSSGSLADWVPGRNFPSQWTANNDGYRFTPNGATYTVASIPFAAIPLGAVGGITWYNSNGGVIGNSNTLFVNPPSSTFYSATLFTCAGQFTDTVNVTVNPVIADSSFQNSTCFNVFDGFCIAEGLNAGPYTYTWYDSTGIAVQTHFGINGPDTLNYLGAGNYSVHLINSTGCKRIINYTLVTNTFQANFIINPSPACEESMVTFTNTSVGIPIIYDWSFGDPANQVSILPSPSIAFYDTGFFTITMIVTVNGGCKDTATQVLQLWPAQVGAYIVTPLTVCENQQLTFKDRSYAYPVSWEWSFGDTSANGNGATVLHSYPNAGQYNVSLIVTDSLCGIDTVAGIINVNEYPITNIGNDTGVCKGTQLILDAGVPGVVYTWSTGASTQTITVSPQQATEYNVTLNNHGCTFNDAIEIAILCELYIPNAFSPNRDGVNDLFIPFGTEVTHVFMRVYNRWGQMVYTGSSDKLDKGWNGFFGAEEAPIGVYTYVIKATFINNQTKEYKGNVTLIR